MLGVAISTKSVSPSVKMSSLKGAEQSGKGEGKDIVLNLINQPYIPETIPPFISKSNVLFFLSQEGSLSCPKIHGVTQTYCTLLVC